MFGSSPLFKLLRLAAVVLLPLVLSACLTAGEESKGISFTDDRGYSNQPYPNNYKGEILAFMTLPHATRAAVIPAQDFFWNQERGLREQAAVLCFLWTVTKQ